MPWMNIPAAVRPTPVRVAGQTARRVTFVFDAEGVLRDVIDDEREMSAHPDGAVEAVQRLVDAAAG